MRRRPREGGDPASFVSPGTAPPRGRRAWPADAVIRYGDRQPMNATSRRAAISAPIAASVLRGEHLFRPRQQLAFLARDVRGVGGAEHVDVLHRQVARRRARRSPTAAGAAAPSARRAPRARVPAAARGCARRRGDDEPREQALLLVGVVVDRRRVEVAHDRRRRGARVGVRMVLGQVPQQAVERRQLALDAPVARAQHAERIVEAGRRVHGKRVMRHGGSPCGFGERVCGAPIVARPRPSRERAPPRAYNVRMRAMRRWMQRS